MIKSLVALMIGLAGIAQAEEAWREPDWQASTEGRQALVKDFRVVESEPAGGCGEHDFSVYGSAEVPALSYCARALKYRMQGRTPDFLVSGIRVGSEIGGPSGWVFEDVLLRYRNGNWSETVIMAIHGSEKAD